MKKWPIETSALTIKRGMQGVYELFYAYKLSPWLSAAITNNYASAQRDAEIYRRSGARVRIVFITQRCVAELSPLKQRKIRPSKPKAKKGT